MTTEKGCYPTTSELAAELEACKGDIEIIEGEDGEPGFDVRLQVTEGDWSLHTGDASYDTDHHGFWGAGFLTPDTDCAALAEELIEEARDHEAQSE